MVGDKTGAGTPKSDERGRNRGLGLTRVVPASRTPPAPRPTDPARTSARLTTPTGERIKAPSRTGSPATGNAAGEPLPFEPRHEDKRLTVGTGILLKGEVSACERLIVHGRMEAELSDSNTLVIAESGEFCGDARVAEADISGHFDGTLTVSGRLTVRSTGCVVGTIRYGELEIERGGRLAGEVRFTSEDAPEPAEDLSEETATDRVEV